MITNPAIPAKWWAAAAGGRSEVRDCYQSWKAQRAVHTTLEQQMPGEVQREAADAGGA
jgi:hypothetical protein